MLGRLPQVSVKIKVRGIWAENESGKKETKLINTSLTEGPGKDWFSVHAEQEYVIIIEIAKESLGFKVRTYSCSCRFCGLSAVSISFGQESLHCE